VNKGKGRREADRKGERGKNVRALAERRRARILRLRDTADMQTAGAGYDE